jgi:hypothetical protein
MGTDAQVPLAHRLEHRHLLDAVWIEVLQLEPILKENRPAGTEKPRSWKATNETTYPAGGRGTDSSPGTFHSTKW